MANQFTECIRQCVSWRLSISLAQIYSLVEHWLSASEFLSLSSDLCCLQRNYISPPEVWDLLVSDASWYHHREAQNHSPEHSRSPFLAGGMIFPPPSGMLDPCQSSSNNWKLISFNSTWHHHHHKKKKILPFFYIFIFLSFPC